MIQLFSIIDPTLLSTFVLAGVALNLMPGADVMFTAATALRGGPWAGVAAAAGISLGSLVHVAITALGVSALFAAYPVPYDIVRWAGVAYLLYLAFKTWHAPIDPQIVTTTGTIKTALIRGAMTNILNPKVALFVLAFLPNFTNPSLGPIAPQILILGIVFAATGFVITSGYGLLAGVMRKAIQSNQNFINKLSASVYAILALRLATQ